MTSPNREQAYGVDGHLDDGTIKRRKSPKHRPYELAQLRLGFAKHYLTQSELTSKEMAQLLGYDVPNSFSRAFTSAVGMAPREFRENYRSN